MNMRTIDSMRGLIPGRNKPFAEPPLNRSEQKSAALVSAYNRFNGPSTVQFCDFRTFASALIAPREPEVIDLDHYG